MASFSTKKHIKTFEYRIHWNINIRKNQFLYEKIDASVRWNKHSGEQHWLKKYINTMSVMLFTGATFVKKKKLQPSC